MPKFFNTLTRQVQEFQPESGTVRLYSCGPTVYNYAHIGNFRSYLFADSFFKVLKYNHLNVDWVMNLTDVDDKTIRDTIKEYGNDATVDDLRKFTDKYIEIFLDELAQINIDAKQIRIIRVADVIPQIQNFVLELMHKGYAYQTDDGVYFNIEKYQQDFGDYGALVGANFLAGKKVGARVKVDEYEKENLSDFALWKAHDKSDAQIFWEHEILGKGRPGWHIECSVINHVAFGNNVTDIHTGGVDLIFPHHTNEIAQSQPLHKPFVNMWMHNEHVTVDNKKMAKRDGNFFTLRDLTDKDPLNALAFRYLCLQTDFRKQMNFTWEALAGAHSALTKLREKVSSIPPSPRLRRASKSQVSSLTPDNAQRATREYVTAFSNFVSNDLNLPQALATAWKVVNDSSLSAEDKYNLLIDFDRVLGLGLDHTPVELSPSIPQNIQNLLDEREQARKEKDYKKADALRRQIEDLGFEVRDGGDDSLVSKK